MLWINKMKLLNTGEYINGLVITKVDELGVYVYCKKCGNDSFIGKYAFNRRKNCSNPKCFANKHGMRYTRFYGIWKGIQGRCLHKSNSGYKKYGGVGIESAWKNNFLLFKDEMYRSYAKHVEEHGEKNTTIDRIDNSKGYSKENCRWATQLEQNSNRTVSVKIDGKSLETLAKETGLTYKALHRRYSLGDRGEDLIRGHYKKRLLTQSNI